MKLFSVKQMLVSTMRPAIRQEEIARGWLIKLAASTLTLLVAFAYSLYLRVIGLGRSTLSCIVMIGLFVIHKVPRTKGAGCRRSL